MRSREEMGEEIKCINSGSKNRKNERKKDKTLNDKIRYDSIALPHFFSSFMMSKLDIST